MKQLALPLAALALIGALEAQTPVAAPTSAPNPWLPRPVIIVDPRPYLTSPSPHPAHRATPRPTHHPTPHPHATPVHRHPAVATTPETFERIETSPSPAPHRR